MTHASDPYPVAVGYKRTTAGVIPVDWLEYTIGDLVRFEGGSQPEKSVFRSAPQPGYVRMIQIRDYKSDRFEVYVPQHLARRFCTEADIMIGRYGPPVFQILRGLAGAYNVALIKAIPQEQIHPAYAYFFLKSEPLFSFVEKLSRRSSGQTGVDLGELRNYPLPLPSLQSEQSAIATALTDADALIDSLEQLLTKKRQIKQGAMQELLTGQRRLPGFSGEWKSVLLDEVAKVKTGSMNNQDKVEDGEYPFFVRSQAVERIGTYTHDCEAILVPGEGGIGSIFHYIHGRFALHQRVYGITDFSAKVLGRFLFFYMRVFFGSHAMENSVKATVDSLRLPTFLNFGLRLPPTKEEQSAIVGVLSDLEREAEALESRLTKARALKQAMAQALLTGRIRLVGREGVMA